MASEAQVRANRRNAEQSTGPRTPEGKASIAQNAVKHGLAGRVDVIKGEDQAEFERHREALLAELRPGGAVESMLVERVVSLSWRLKRVERMQNEVFDALLANGATPLAKLARSMMPGRSEDDEELALGRAVVKDFSNSRVLDRLLMYERRMEHSLLKTLNDLQLRRLRVREYISRHMDEIGAEPAGSVPVRAPLRWGEDGGAGSEGLASPIPAATFFSQETPDGVTTNAPEASVVAEQACKTNPISFGPDAGQVSDMERVTTRSVDGAFAETKPIEREESDYCPAHDDAESLMVQVASARTTPPWR